MTNILFIGGAGFIGSSLVQKLKEKSGYKICVFEPPLANISRLKLYFDEITIVRGFLSDYDLIKSVIVDHNINVVVHLVSTLIPGSTYMDYTKEFEHVIFPSVKLMGLCADRSIKFVYFSSGGTVYGNNTDGKFRESDKLAPISYYGLSKQIIEDSVLFENRTKGLSYLILRPSNPYGPGQLINANQGLIAVALGKILAREPIIIWGNGTNVRDYIYIEDLAQSFVQLIENKVTNLTINIGSGMGYSINEVLSILRETAQSEINVIHELTRSVDVNSMVLDISTLRSLVDMHQTSLESGIAQFFQNVIATIKN